MFVHIILRLLTFLFSEMPNRSCIMLPFSNDSVNKNHVSLAVFPSLCFVNCPKHYKFSVLLETEFPMLPEGNGNKVDLT
jgi:hypothetical protein